MLALRGSLVGRLTVVSSFLAGCTTTPLDGDVTDWNQFGHGLTPSWSPTYDRLRIGYQSWNADTPIDVWYDAVAVDSERIGCAR